MDCEPNGHWELRLGNNVICRYDNFQDTITVVLHYGSVSEPALEIPVMTSSRNNSVSDDKDLDISTISGK